MEAPRVCLLLRSCGQITAGSFIRFRGLRLLPADQALNLSCNRLASLPTSVSTLKSLQARRCIGACVVMLLAQRQNNLKIVDSPAGLCGARSDAHVQ